MAVARISDSHWLAPWEQDEVCERLLDFGLVKFDNSRSLPLKSGGKTDIYINLREARRVPEAIDFLAALFVNPLLRLAPGLFVEVPDSVSCFAGLLSVRLGMPYITIREEAKEGRVAKAKAIGAASYGQKACILDDVITDGASKIVPLRECESMGLKMLPLVVLVDRQQGWKKKFGEAGISMEVWSGMTLHDVRRYLVAGGIMQRCDKDLEAKNPLIIALDGKSWEDVLSIVDPLRTTGCIFKVNDLLFAKGIESLVPNLQVYGRVMVDLKGHDIPNTLENISRRCLQNPPWAVTVHASGGEAMIKAVVDVLKGTETKVLAVTVLTSIDPTTCQGIYHATPIDQVKALVQIADKAGAHGFVCSPEEVKDLKASYPGKIFVTPGVRSPGADAGDQKRIGTPVAAREDGADYLVMGRQICENKNPVAEVTRLLAEELKVL